MQVFNQSVASVMHIDINSCFATIEQQANPFLRGTPIAVAAYNSPRGCILAASIEAKRYGIKTGMKVHEGQSLCPAIVILSPDPPKYRAVHIRLKNLLERYTDIVIPRSIDEFVLDFAHIDIRKRDELVQTALSIKKRINEEIGEWIRVSVGVGPNRFLAKTGANYQKPDGLVEINYRNFEKFYKSIKLTDLCGISRGNAARLHSSRIYSVWDFYQAPLSRLKTAFQSVLAHYWYYKLRGYEADNAEIVRRSFSHIYSLPYKDKNISDISPIICKVVEKVGFRMRRAGYMAKGIGVSVAFRNHTHWHQNRSYACFISSSADIYKCVCELLKNCPDDEAVFRLSVVCFSVKKKKELQFNMFENVVKKESLVKAVDKVNSRWGDFVLTSARMANTNKFVPDTIGFGNPG